MHITYPYPQQPAIMFIIVSFFLVIAIYTGIYILCKHYAGAICTLHCALFNNYHTQLPSHQLHLHKRCKKFRGSLPRSSLGWLVVFVVAAFLIMLLVAGGSLISSNSVPFVFQLKFSESIMDSMGVALLHSCTHCIMPSLSAKSC